MSSSVLRTRGETGAARAPIERCATSITPPTTAMHIALLAGLDRRAERGGRGASVDLTRTQTGRSSGIDYLLPEETLEVHPADVVAWGLRDGGWASMASPRGEVTIKVAANDRSPRGTVFASFSFNDVPINVLTGSGYDPITQTAELKVCPVRIAACEAPVKDGVGAARA